MKSNNKYSKLYQHIWKIIEKIPAGKVATYGQIAHIAGFGGNARIVGYALHRLPDNSNVPWHRVINSKGKISLSKDDGAYDVQKALLEKENIQFIHDKIDLEIYKWQPKNERFG